MGFLDGFRSMLDPIPTLVRDEPESEVSALAEELYALMEARRSAFGMGDALKLPPVIRARLLICSIAASFLPLVYQQGAALTMQPRIVRKPNPFGTRFDHVFQTVDGLLQDGCAYWLLTDHDGAYPRSASVLPHDEVNVQWDARRFLPEYSWRGRKLIRDVEIKHITIGRRPGELHGRGPLREGLDYLYPIKAAEDYAATFFMSGGLPTTVLKSSNALTKDEAAKLKRQWVESREGPEPAVLPPGLDADFPGTDPESAQMAASREYGNTVVARLLGIPAALMHVSTSGATITYTNPAGAVEELVKATIAPTFLAAIEAAWSELVPAPQSIRFDLADLQRADMAARFAIYKTGVETVDPKTGEPLMSVAEARAYEGWSPLATEAGHAFDPVPSEVETVLPLEVPA